MKPISKKIYLVWMRTAVEDVLCGLFLTRKSAQNYVDTSRFSSFYRIEVRYASNF